MAWQGIEGHDEIVANFRRSMQAGRLGSTFLFVGPDGIGKRTFALKLAASLLCESIRDGHRPPLDPCGVCPACVQVASGSHPDLQCVAKPADRTTIPVELFIGPKAHRMREGLCAWIALRPSIGTRKVAIVDDADFLNQEGANCLLKTLEEPPPGSVLILVGTSPERQLPTIRSRSQVVRFRPLPPDVCQRLLQQQGLLGKFPHSDQLIAMAAGSLAAAIKWNGQELWDFRDLLLEQLAQPQWNSQLLAKQTSAFVDAAGKEAPKRRERLRMVIDIVMAFYRAALRCRVDASPGVDVILAQAADRLLRSTPIEPEVLADCIDRTMLARTHVDANANQATNIDAWLDELSQILCQRSGIAHAP